MVDLGRVEDSIALNTIMLPVFESAWNEWAWNYMERGYVF